MTCMASSNLRVEYAARGECDYSDSRSRAARCGKHDASSAKLRGGERSENAACGVCSHLDLRRGRSRIQDERAAARQHRTSPHLLRAGEQSKNSPRSQSALHHMFCATASRFTCWTRWRRSTDGWRPCASSSARARIASRNEYGRTCRGHGAQIGADEVVGICR